ncbi:MAG: hypothetical protein ACXACW_07890, partial [Candidatus Hodarchaeales archaeon]
KGQWCSIRILTCFPNSNLTIFRFYVVTYDNYIEPFHNISKDLPNFFVKYFQQYMLHMIYTFHFTNEYTVLSEDLKTKVKVPNADQIQRFMHLMNDIEFTQETSI